MHQLLDKHIHESELLIILEEMIKCPSHPGIDHQETAVAEYIHSFFIKEGIESELVHVQDGRKNIIARIRGNGTGKNLLLTGHTDTVPPYDMEDPFTLKISGDQLIGRGANDMKGPLASMMIALATIKRSGIQLDGDLVFAGVIDEEEKSLGTIHLIEKGIRADGAIVGEPTNLDICIAHRGLEWFSFLFEGKAVHGGKQQEGINAIQKASKFIQELENQLIPKLNRRIHPIAGCSTINYGTIQGGTQPSTVAGECLLSIDRRWIPGEKYDDIIKEFEDILNQLSYDDPQFKASMQVLESSIMKKGYVHEAMEIDPNHVLVKTLEHVCLDILKTPIEKTYFTAWSDGGLLHHYANIPTLVFGPGDLETAHSKNEFINRHDLVKAARIYASIAYLFCNQIYLT